MANVLGKCLAPWAQALKPTSSPGGGNVALTTGIPSGTENKGLLLRSIANTESRRANFLKPCGRTPPQGCTVRPKYASNYFSSGMKSR
jgi:hypothetical protein